MQARGIFRAHSSIAISRISNPHLVVALTRIAMVVVRLREGEGRVTHDGHSSGAGSVYAKCTHCRGVGEGVG